MAKIITHAASSDIEGNLTLVDSKGRVWVGYANFPGLIWRQVELPEEPS